jgi:hypothetical protein
MQGKAFYEQKIISQKNIFLWKKFYYWSFMDSSSIFKAFGVILVHLEVDKMIFMVI